jgi:hypothetical protein
VVNSCDQTFLKLLKVTIKSTKLLFLEMKIIFFYFFLPLRPKDALQWTVLNHEINFYETLKSSEFQSIAYKLFKIHELSDSWVTKYVWLLAYVQNIQFVEIYCLIWFNIEYKNEKKTQNLNLNLNLINIGWKERVVYKKNETEKSILCIFNFNIDFFKKNYSVRIELNFE